MRGVAYLYLHVHFIDQKEKNNYHALYISWGATSLCKFVLEIYPHIIQVLQILPLYFFKFVGAKVGGDPMTKIAILYRQREYIFYAKL